MEAVVAVLSLSGHPAESSIAVSPVAPVGGSRGNEGAAGLLRGRGPCFPAVRGCGVPHGARVHLSGHGSFRPRLAWRLQEPIGPLRRPARGVGRGSRPRLPGGTWALSRAGAVAPLGACCWARPAFHAAPARLRAARRDGLRVGRGRFPPEAGSPGAGGWPPRVGSEAEVEERDLSRLRGRVSQRCP